MKFRKHVTIEAIRWDGTRSGQNLITDAFPGVETTLYHYASQHWKIETLEGSQIVNVGDWVIKGEKSECYPCKPDIFELTYERVEEQS